MSKHEFEAVIEKPPKGSGAFVSIPFDVPTAFGTKGPVKVKATFDGHPYRGSIAPMGGRHVLGVLKDIQHAIAKSHGDSVRVVVELDTEVREVTVPAELQNVLRKNARAKAFYESLSYTNRKEYAQWIASAKKDETRQKRLEKALAMLLAGIKHP